ncbi:MAG: Hint domain-containing protein [Paracoccaceae bacterium]
MKNDAVAPAGRCRPDFGGVGGLVSVTQSAKVLTRDGEIPAEHLVPGDDLVARDGGYVTLKLAMRVRQQVRTIWVQDGFLNGLAPEGGVMLPAHQRVLQRDLRTAPVPASFLVSLERAEDIGIRQLTVIQLWLEHSDTIYAAGLELPAAQVDRRLQDAA